jgi:uncharacterized protein (TIGR02145 family)
MKLFLSLLALAFNISFASDNIKDHRDGKTYKTVKIGEQIWMAENLNYEAEGSKCQKNEPANCKKYGRLYDWNTAKTACPAGWHLPSDEEWNVLMTAVGGIKTAGKFLKATSGWNSSYEGKSGNGTDAYGFSALPGGWGSSDGSFWSAGDYGNWWSSSDYSSYHTYYQDTNYYHETALYVNLGKSYFQSVRCVRD